jgi:hypothetical protein
MVGLFLMIFVKNSIKDNIYNIETMTNRTGVFGTFGNKGGLNAKFNFLDDTFVFSCNHLASGQSSVNNRVNEMIETLNKSFPKSSNKRFKDANFQFIFGDLNFRLELDIPQVINLIEKKAYKTLISYDQFNKFKSVNTQLYSLTEGELLFDPTYKYSKGTNEYDIKKKRVPSWCDRILFNKSNKIHLLEYNRVEYTVSDHKPVYGVFRINTQSINKEEKVKILKEIKSNYDNNIKSMNIDPNTIMNNMNDNFFGVNNKEEVNNFDQIEQGEEKDLINIDDILNINSKKSSGKSIEEELNELSLFTGTSDHKESIKSGEHEILEYFKLNK